MRIASLFVIAAFFLAASQSAWATPTAQSVPAKATGAPAPQPDPSTTGAAASHRPARTYAQCNRVAQQRRLRGAERRHFVFRCQLGYGRALFRRRSTEHH